MTILWISPLKESYAPFYCADCGEEFDKGDGIYLAKDIDENSIKLCEKCGDEAEVEEADNRTDYDLY